MESKSNDTFTSIENNYTITENDRIANTTTLPEGKKKTKIWIGGLPPRTEKVTLKTEFIKAFGIDAKYAYEIAVLIKLGYGFVTVPSFLMAKIEPQQNTRNVMIHGKKLELSIAQSRKEAKKKNEDERNKKLYVGNVPTDVTKDELEKYFKKFGALEYANQVYAVGSTMPRGFAFVKYINEKSAFKALAYKKHTLKGADLVLKKSVPKQEIDMLKDECNKDLKHIDKSDYDTEYGHIVDIVDKKKKPNHYLQKNYDYTQKQDKNETQPKSNDDVSLSIKTDYQYQKGGISESYSPDFMYNVNSDYRKSPEFVYSKENLDSNKNETYYKEWQYDNQQRHSSDNIQEYKDHNFNQKLYQSDYYTSQPNYDYQAYYNYSQDYNYANQSQNQTYYKYDDYYYDNQKQPDQYYYQDNYYQPDTNPNYQPDYNNTYDYDYYKNNDQQQPRHNEFQYPNYYENQEQKICDEFQNMSIKDNNYNNQSYNNQVNEQHNNQTLSEFGPEYNDTNKNKNQSKEQQRKN